MSKKSPPAPALPDVDDTNVAETPPEFAHLVVRFIPVERLAPYMNNAREHSSAQVDQIVASVKEFGWTNPILIARDLGILAGHGRLQAAQRLGLKVVPCLMIGHLSKAQQKMLILADNKIAENATWNLELLRHEIGELKLEGVDLSFTGFSAGELSDLFAGSATGPSAAGDDDVPEVRPDPVSVRGDVWLLGDHRLRCGDSTSSLDVEALMKGDKAQMVLTDPPFGMKLDCDFSKIKGSSKSLGRKKAVSGQKHKNVIGDHEDFSADLIKTIFANFHYCKEIFLWGADYYAEHIPGKNDGGWLVWDKRKENQADAIGSEFELCWSKGKHKRRVLRHDWFGFLSSGNTEEARNRVHPTQKPTSLMIDIFEQWGKFGDLVVDLYAGSGTTLIACEKTGRKCYAMELDPSYCDVIVERWQNITGKTAEHEASGKTLDDLRRERARAAPVDDNPDEIFNSI